MIVITHLVLSDLLKIKGEIVDILMLLDSDDAGLKDLINLFLHEINVKGNNTIYNSNLSMISIIKEKIEERHHRIKCSTLNSK